MPQKHGNNLPLPFMRTADLVNGTMADAKFIQTYGGNNRFLREWTTGEVTADNPPVAPSTPQRAFGDAAAESGHDHSGGVMGRPFVHTLWSAVWGYPIDVINTANMDGGAAVRNRVTVGVTETRIIGSTMRTLWIPNCPPDGCYISALLTVYVYATAACEVRVRMEDNITPGPGHVIADETFSISATTNTRCAVATKVRLIPGRVQFGFLQVFARYTAATANVSLLSAALHQTKTAA